MAAMYSAKTLDHFQNPRNAGDLEKADAIAEMENPVCGDVIRLSVKTDRGQISAIRFKAKGCVPAIASGSALTELVLGKTLAEARKTTLANLTALLGSLPQASEHAPQLALDVLRAALGKIDSTAKP